MNSSVCRGWIDHRRHTPRIHAFRYRIGMLYVDLAEQEHMLGLSRLLRPWSWAPCAGASATTCHRTPALGFLWSMPCARSSMKPWVPLPKGRFTC